MIRRLTKQNETEARKALVKNGKYFVPPESDDMNFKALFKRLASVGAGRPVDTNGFPQGPWTPDLLSEAISQIDANQSGIELRTAQLWFQDNEKGISSDNIRWLARIFGCDDPEATSEWQAELSASQARLTAKRRQGRRQPRNSVQDQGDADRPVDLDIDTAVADGSARLEVGKKATGKFSLARKSEALFGRGSVLDLPASIFAGAVALGFLSVFLGIHSVEYLREDGTLKQVGFLWAPNWTFLFMVFMPLFFAFTVDIIGYWKKEGRSKLLPGRDGEKILSGWTGKVEASSYTYWAVFLICIGFAGVFQWIGVRLIPLIEGGDDYARDWGSIGITHPEIISVSQAVAFTGFAYLHMCLCFYLFFVGLILIFTLVDDLWETDRATEPRTNMDTPYRNSEVTQRIIWGIFRCTISGLLIAICMKVQASYLTTSSVNVPSWLFRDSASVIFELNEGGDRAS